jgi:bifunctional non-homologous end joining protein LigD
LGARARNRSARRLTKGDLKIVLQGERLHGGFVLVRMKHDRNGGKRNNWLLIKHRDEFANDGDDDALLKENATSIASGRAMEDIDAGRGKAPSPFMTTTKRKADSVWQSKPRDSAQPERSPPYRGSWSLSSASPSTGRQPARVGPMR